jgi:hypothetical protein
MMQFLSLFIYTSFYYIKKDSSKKESEIFAVNKVGGINFLRVKHIFCFIEFLNLIFILIKKSQVIILKNSFYF